MEIRIRIDDRWVNRWRAFARRCTRRRAAGAVGLLIAGASLVAIAGPLTKPHTFEAGDAIIASEINANFDALYAALNDRIIRDARVVSITPGDTCEGLIQALNDLEESRIVAGGSVRVELAPGTYACPTSVEVSHSDGERISIVGAGDAPGDVTLSFPPDVHGFVVEGSRALGTLSNLTLIGNGAAGILADRGGSLAASRVVVRNFDVGIQAQGSASVVGVDLVLENNSQAGALASRASSMRLDETVAQSNNFGFRSEAAASMVLTNCEALDNMNQGYYAITNAVLTAVDSIAQGNLDGFYAYERASIYGTGMIVIDNSERYGIVASRGGQVSFLDAPILSDNATDTNIAVANTGSVIVY